MDILTSEKMYTPLEADSEWATLEAYKTTLETLSVFQDSLTPERGVCQAQVKALIDECQLVLEERTPLQSFTKDPSVQNLSVVTEGILHRAAQVTKDFIKKAGELIMKMLSWIMAFFKKLTNRHRTLHERVILLKAVKDANKEASAVVGNVHVVDEAITKAEQALQEAIQRYIDHSTALAAALLSEGPFLGAIKGIGLQMAHTPQYIADKVSLAVNALKEHPRDKYTMAQQLALLATPIPLSGLERVAKSYHPLQNAPMLLDYFQQLKTHVAQLHDTHPAGQMEWQIASTVVVDPRSGFNEPLVPIPDDVYRVFEILNAKIEELMTDGVKANVDSSLEPAYQAAMMSLVGEVHALTFYVEAVNMVLDTQVSLAESLYRCQVAQFELYRAKGQISNDPAIVEALNKVQHTLRDQITRR